MSGALPIFDYELLSSIPLTQYSTHTTSNNLPSDPIRKYINPYHIPHPFNNNLNNGDRQLPKNPHLRVGHLRKVFYRC